MTVKRINGSSVAFGAQVNIAKLSRHMFNKYYMSTSLVRQELNALKYALMNLGSKNDIIEIKGLKEGVKNGQNILRIKGKINSSNFDFVQDDSTFNMSKIYQKIENSFKVLAQGQKSSFERLKDAV